MLFAFDHFYDDPAFYMALAGFLTAAAGWLRSHTTVKRADRTIRSVNGGIVKLHAAIGELVTKADTAADRAIEAANIIADAAKQATHERAALAAGQVSIAGRVGADIPVTVTETAAGDSGNGGA